MPVEHYMIPLDLLRVAVRDARDDLERLPVLVEGPGAESLAFFLVMEHFPDRIPGVAGDELKLFYSRVYHFNRYVCERSVADGPDAGLEQQAFKILETAPNDVDWQLVEEAVERAKA